MIWLCPQTKSHSVFHLYSNFHINFSSHHLTCLCISKEDEFSQTQHRYGHCYFTAPPKDNCYKFPQQLIAERGNWDRRILISPKNFYVNGKQYSFISSSPKYLEYRKLHLEAAPWTLVLHSMCDCTLGSTWICNSRKRLWDALDKRVLPSPLAVCWWEAGLPGWLLQVDDLASES